MGFLVGCLVELSSVGSRIVLSIKVTSVFEVITRIRLELIS
jgi:hypothetical protein